MHADSTSFILEADLALDVLACSGADTNVVSAWVGYKNVPDDVVSYEKPRVIFQRAHDALTALYLKVADADSHYNPLTVHERIRVNCLEPRDVWGNYTLIQLTERAGAHPQYSWAPAVLSIPKDLPDEEKTFEIMLPSKGGYVFADSKIPMILHAPGYWEPSWPAKYYFNLSKDSKDAQIFFEGPAKLFEPSGILFGTNTTIRGWIDLPDSKPGFWSFEQTEGHNAVRVRNIPPFFAVGDSNLYFTPPTNIVWEREKIPEPISKIPPGTTYVPGAGSTPTNQALYLGAGRRLQIPAGTNHPAGDGGIYLPCNEGTIEFFIKPDWDSLELTAQPRNSVPMLTAEGTSFGLSYATRPEFSYGEKGGIGVGMSYVGKDGKKHEARFQRGGAIFEHDQWTHVAVVWGRGMLAVFINGRLGGKEPAKIEGPLSSPMKALVIGGWLSAIDELRISDIARYTETFRPPLPDREFALDEHTRALFHFNGNCQGVSYDQTNTVKAEIK
jgi:hypothetical protein